MIEIIDALAKGGDTSAVEEKVRKEVADLARELLKTAAAREAHYY